MSVQPLEPERRSAPATPEEWIAGERCPLCGDPGEAIGAHEGYPLRECRCRGGVLLSFPWPSEGAYRDWYAQPGAYHEQEQRENGQQPSIARDTEHLRAGMHRLALLRALGATGGRLLDLGTGCGSFVALAAAAGYESLGFEPNVEMADFAASLGRDVRRGGWEETEGRFDVITLHDVFEHLTRPWACLRHLRAQLHTGGLLVIEMPEYLGLHSRRSGLAWKHIRPLQHVCLYSESAARTLFDRAGWEVEAVVRPLRGQVGKVTYYLARREEVSGG